MQKVNLKQAKELLLEMGYNLEISYDEALVERYDVIEDMLWKLYGEMDSVMNWNEYKTLIDIVRPYLESKKGKIMQQFVKYYDDNDTISDIYHNIISWLIKDIKCPLAFDFISNTNPNIKNLLNKEKHGTHFCVKLYDVKKKKYTVEKDIFFNFYDALLFFEAYEFVDSNKETTRLDLLYKKDDEEMIITSKSSK